VSPDIYDDELAGKVAEENLTTLLQDKKALELNQPVEPVNVCITNSSSQLTYQLCSMLCSQQVCDGDIQITLLDGEVKTEQAEGVALEVMDMCSNHVKSVKVTNNATEAFKQAAIIFILDQFSADTDISTVAYHYHNYAKLLDNSSPANGNTKVIVYGLYSELAVSIMVHYSNCMKRSQFCSSHYFTEQQVKSVIANKLNINPANISGVAIWGSTIDLSQCRISQYNGAIVGPPHFTLPLDNCLFDTKWLEEDFFKEFSSRSSKVGYKDGSPCVAEATSLLHHIQDWINGSEQFHSIGIVSDGTIAAITDGLCVCVPTQYNNGTPLLSSTTISDNINTSLTTYVNELTQLYQKALNTIG